MAESKGVRVVVAQDSAEAGEGVALELPGLLIVAQRPQGEAEEAGRCAVCRGGPRRRTRRLRVEGVALELPGLLVLAQRAQVAAEDAG